jgi:hypothetical protein
LIFAFRYQRFWLKFNVHWPGENNVAVPATAKQPWVKPRAEGLFEMTVGSGRFQRLQVRFYVETRGYNSILGALYHKMRSFSRGFLGEKTGKDGH